MVVDRVALPKSSFKGSWLKREREREREEKKKVVEEEELIYIQLRIIRECSNFIHELGPHNSLFSNQSIGVYIETLSLKI